MTITVPDPSPSKTQAALFDAYVENFFEVAFPRLVGELRDAVTAFNNGSTWTNSTTSHTIDLTQNKTFIVSADLSFVKGQWVTVMSQVTADTNNAMYGIVRSYSGTSLAFDPKWVTGSGTLANWKISLNPPYDLATNTHWCGLNTGNGYGSTNTRIRNFTNIETGAGTACTATTSATLGAAITINNTGLYQVSYGEGNPGVSGTCFVSRNSAALTVAPSQASQIMSFDVAAASNLYQGERVIRLTAGDVLRAHPSVATFTGTTDCYFRCEMLKPF